MVVVVVEVVVAEVVVVAMVTTGAAALAASSEASLLCKMSNCDSTLTPLSKTAVEREIPFVVVLDTSPDAEASAAVFRCRLPCASTVIEGKVEEEECIEEEEEEVDGVAEINDTTGNTVSNVVKEADKSTDNATASLLLLLPLILARCLIISLKNVIYLYFHQMDANASRQDYTMVCRSTVVVFRDIYIYIYTYVYGIISYV